MYRFRESGTQTLPRQEFPTCYTDSGPSGPRGSNGMSSSTGLGFTSSSGTKPRSFRQRLFPEPKEPDVGAGATQPTPPSLPKQKHVPQVPTFLQKLQSGFQQPRYEPRRAYRYVPMSEEPSSSTLSPPESPMLGELKDNFLKSAQHLHERAFTGLAAVHAGLETRLRAITIEDAAFLAAVDRQVRKLAQPLSGFEMQSTTRDPRTGASRTQCTHVGALIADARGDLAAAEAELARLWGEWEARQAEVDAAAVEIVSGCRPTQHRDAVVAVDAADAFGRDAEEFGKEVNGLVEDTLLKMKSCETAHRQMILADVQIWLEAINA